MPSVSANPTNIHQIFMNLCTNASYAMKERGGILEIKLDTINTYEKKANKILNLKSEIYLRLSVKDTGGGMDKETIKHIFEG